MVAINCLKGITIIVVLPILGLYGCGLSKMFSEPRARSERPKSVVGYSSNQSLGLERRQELARHNREALNQYLGEEDFYKNSNHDRHPHSCLALSGGGVRSALFSIGVMKALHQRKVLQEIDIISAVSGGAYAAAWYLAQQLETGVPPTEDVVWKDHLEKLSAKADEIKNHTVKYPELLILPAPLNILRHRVANITGVNWKWLRNNSYASLYSNAIRGAYFYRGDDERIDYSLQTMETLLRRQHGPLFVVNSTTAIRSLLLEDRVFEVTPYHKGSNALGYHLVSEKELDDLDNLIEAVAISGAAFDGEAYGGVTKWLLKSLSVGLGKYVKWKDGKEGMEYSIYLSDGGHSENLGVYSLVRRLCEEVTVVDAEFDPTYEFEGYVLLKCALKREMGVDLKVDGIDQILRPREELLDRVGECRDLIDAKNRRQGVFDNSKPIMRGSIGIFPLEQANGKIKDRGIELRYIKLSIDESRLGVPNNGTVHARGEVTWYGEEVEKTYVAAQLDLKRKWCVPKRWVTSQAYFPQRTTMDQMFSKELAQAYISLGISTVDHYWENADTPSNGSR